MMPDAMKRCIECNELLPMVSFRKGKNQCNACRKAYMKAYYQTDKYKARRKAYYQTDKYKARRKAYYQTDKYKAYQKAYQKAYEQTDKRKAYRQTDKRKAYMKAYQKAYKQTDKYKAYKKARVEDLADGYVKKLLTQNTFLHCADVPPELVAVKRLEIRLKRMLKNEHK